MAARAAHHLAAKPVLPPPPTAPSARCPVAHSHPQAALPPPGCAEFLLKFTLSPSQVALYPRFLDLAQRAGGCSLLRDYSLLKKVSPPPFPGQSHHGRLLWVLDQGLWQGLQPALGAGLGVWRGRGNYSCRCPCSTTHYATHHPPRPLPTRTHPAVRSAAAEWPPVCEDVPGKHPARSTGPGG
jgi:hypothetical protein